MDVDHAGDIRYLCTSRLALAPVGVGDLEAMAALHADERVWRHFPDGRHADVEQTRAYLVERERQWTQDGLGYWVVGLREPIGALNAGQIAGIGGCARPVGATWWNLYYRLTPEIQGHGIATEMCGAAITAARRIDSGRPVVAFLLEHNRASKATAERAGLALVSRGPDAGNPDPTAVRLVYADRPLKEEQINALLGQRK